MNNGSKDRLIIVLAISLAAVCLVFMLLVGGFLAFLFLLPDDEMNDANEVYELQENDDEDSSVQDIQNSQDQDIGNPSSDTLSSTANNDNQENNAQSEQEDVGAENTEGTSIIIPESEVREDALSFVTTTLDGQVVTENIFSDYDLTVVHVWGTYCDPCIKEMGEYAVLYRELPPNVNLIGIVCDVYDGINNNVSEAENILNSTGAGFINLRTSDSIYDITASFQFVPSSFLVDRDGHIVGDLMDGAYFEETRERLYGYLE